MLLLVLYSPESSICFTQMICYLFISIRKVFFVLLSNSTTACVNTFDNKSLLLCLLLSRLIVNTFYFDFLVTRPLFSNLLAEHMEWIRQINAKSPSCFPRQQHVVNTQKDHYKSQHADETWRNWKKDHNTFAVWKEYQAVSSVGVQNKHNFDLMLTQRHLCKENQKCIVYYA